jgi:glutamine amidotransferase
MLGVVSASTRSFQRLLEEAPRSMAWLSSEHPDGWGLALSQREARWMLHRSLLCAAADRSFHDLASRLVGDLLIVHVRQRTHGAIAMENTHPFSAGPWVFTHNGKVADLDYLETRISRERRRGLRGDTDSERLFAFVLTRLDAAQVTAASNPERIAAVLRTVADEIGAHPGLGTTSFLLSEGTMLFAHRRGAPLHLLRRDPGDARSCHDCLGSPCIAVTTEPITDESWLPLDDGDLVRVTRAPQPTWERI